MFFLETCLFLQRFLYLLDISLCGKLGMVCSVMLCSHSLVAPIFLFRILELTCLNFVQPRGYQTIIHTILGDAVKYDYNPKLDALFPCVLLRNDEKNTWNTCAQNACFEIHNSIRNNRWLREGRVAVLYAKRVESCWVVLQASLEWIGTKQAKGRIAGL